MICSALIYSESALALTLNNNINKLNTTENANQLQTNLTRLNNQREPHKLNHLLTTAHDLSFSDSDTLDHTPQIKMGVNNGQISYQTLTPEVWSADEKFQLSKVQLSKVQLSKVQLSSIQHNPISYPNNQTVNFFGSNIQFQQDNIAFNMGMMSNNLNDTFNENLVNETYQPHVEKVYLEGVLSVFSFNAFSLSLEGKMEATQGDNSTIVTLLSADVDNKEESIAHSLSVVGRYTLNDSWAITGAMINTNVNAELQKVLKNKKSRDNMALFGTTYSF